jgi:hypothetical protein
VGAGVAAGGQGVGAGGVGRGPGVGGGGSGHSEREQKVVELYEKFHCSFHLHNRWWKNRYFILSRRDCHLVSANSFYHNMLHVHIGTYSQYLFQYCVV